ncbi:MAG: alpha-amylase family glycosyl hydrolase [Paludibacteraceae bacterium]|nr:alpha-amylase family glycosyl hydrolase [Paludibacteraceae bacterium]
MRKTLLLAAIGCTMLAICPTIQAINVQKTEPLNWWTCMKCPLTLMVYGEDLQGASVTVDNAQCTMHDGGLIIKQVRNADSKNYLFIDLDVRLAGTYIFTLKNGRKKTRFTYEIYERKVSNCIHESFSSKDMIYLLTPDRFRDGDPSNNDMPGMKEKCRKDYIHGRMGGDIQGIMDELPHIKELGATYIWPTPLTWSNDSSFSYHGYACADYYHIDPRFGTNEQYRALVDSAHHLGLKMIWDVVTNHSGTEHWWAKDLPYKDWWHRFWKVDNAQCTMHDEIYVGTINAFTTAYDVNASQYDKKLSEEGWFDHHMPDMNLDNPDLLQYFKQLYIWWIEWAGIDGLRVDTYPYNEKEPMAEWCKAIREEYPWINIVGETWTRPANQVAYWQSGTKNYDGFDSHLPAVMDFPTEEAIRQALENDGNFWGGGMARVYDALTADYMYGDVNNLLLFVGNHDMDRFADIVKDNDSRRVMLGHVLIATMRGIPQMYAGDEYMQRSIDRNMGHSGLRQPLPTADQLTEQQRDVYEQMKALWNWRKQEPVLWTGKTMHWLGRDNTYAYARYNKEEAVLVLINASEETKTMPISRYAEILTNYQPQGTLPLEKNQSIDLTKDIQLAPVSALIVKLLH